MCQRCTLVRTAMATADSPGGLLTDPAPEIRFTRIEFADSPLKEYANLWAVILDNVLTAEECEELIHHAETRSGGAWERAMVNVGLGRQKLAPESRNCDRIVLDDQVIVDRLWQRVAPFVPEIQALKDWPRVTGSGPATRGETWAATRLNERMRFLRYGPNEYFRGKQSRILYQRPWTRY